eukprot:364385-Chlamydomonas_euryale.AAC.11
MRAENARPGPCSDNDRLDTSELSGSSRRTRPPRGSDSSSRAPRLLGHQTTRAGTFFPAAAVSLARELTRRVHRLRLQLRRGGSRDLGLRANCTRLAARQVAAATPRPPCLRCPPPPSPAWLRAAYERWRTARCKLQPGAAASRRSAAPRRARPHARGRRDGRHPPLTAIWAHRCSWPDSGAAPNPSRRLHSRRRSSRRRRPPRYRRRPTRSSQRRRGCKRSCVRRPGANARERAHAACFHS